MWSEVGERSFFGPTKIKDAEERVTQVRENLRIAQSRQKSYVDNRWRDLEFQVRDYVYLKVTLLRGTIRFHVKGKLAPRYVGPYKICQRISKLAYKVELPEDLTGVHLVFHVSQLRKCLQLPKPRSTHRCTRYLGHLRVQGHPIRILDMCKVQWSNHTKREATWEKEFELRMLYPYLFERYVAP
jgi:hypothetical protein